MEVYTLLFARKSDEELLVECWGVFPTDEKAQAAFIEGCRELKCLYKAREKIFDSDRMVIWTDDDVMLELRVDVTTYYAEV